MPVSVNQKGLLRSLSRGPRSSCSIRLHGQLASLRALVRKRLVNVCGDIDDSLFGAVVTINKAGLEALYDRRVRR